MRITDLRSDQEIYATLLYDDGEISADDTGAEITLLTGEILDPVAVIFPDGRRVACKPANSDAEEFVEQVLFWGKTYRCWVSGIVPGKILLQAVVFHEVISFTSEQPLRIIVPDSISDDLPANVNIVYFVTNEFIANGDLFCLLSSGQLKNFIIFGNKWLCEIRLTADGCLVCHRLRRRRKEFLNLPITLVTGAVTFVSETETDARSSFAVRQFSQVTAHRLRYLNIWKLYQEREKVFAIKEVMEHGYVNFTDLRLEESPIGLLGFFKVKGEVPSDFFKEPLSLDIASEPIYVEEGEEYVLPVKTIYAGELIPEMSTDNEVVLSCENARIDDLHHEGFLMYSLAGHTARFKRQKQALTRIETNKAPLPIGPLMEGEIASQRYRRHEGYPLRDLHKILGHPPTKSQQEALDIALNTPDIAIIQGPPGTGKTSIIRALVKRFAEINKKKENTVRKAILVTSYQHDAVDNAIEGVDFIGLPAYRVGGKVKNKNKSLDPRMSKWIEERKSHCRQVIEQLGEHSIRKLTRDIDRLIQLILTDTTPADARLMLMEDIENLAGLDLSTNLSTRLRGIIKRYSLSLTRSHEEDNAHKDLLLVEQCELLLSEQRTTEKAYCNDGEPYLQKLVRFLKLHGGMLDLPVSMLLDHINQVLNIENTMQHRMTTLDTTIQLIQKSLAYPVHNEAVSDSFGIELANTLYEVSQHLRSLAANGSDGVGAALELFIDELDDIDSVLNMIRMHASVIAGTCQQVVAKQFGFTDTIYDIVIVDEASRANPLDLLIPLTLASKVILVGDHKQLPHILEPEIERQLMEDPTVSNANLLRESLFERLYTFLSVGQPQRTSMLTEDFRMHPVISRFVSDTFYEGKITSHFQTKPEEREHNLGLYGNLPLCWINISIRYGAERREGVRLSRSAEVSVIASEVDRILAIPSNLTVGVITFYKRQVELLDDAFSAYPQELRNRLMVGTVDAFQGLEFDVVLLSTVRCNKFRENRTKRLGFLTLPNRLCVAMSRAKRLLVVVGDAETVAGTVDCPGVVELQQFLSICQIGGGWYDER